ncbi:MAG: hypothetical protein MZV63_63715 [Marinilabiliales bacterium]|nr:hypothetical protein [Marinilabiliales bacterium]
MANDIAPEIREKGRPKRTGDIAPFYSNGTIVKHKPGVLLRDMRLQGPDAPGSVRPYAKLPQL